MKWWSFHSGGETGGIFIFPPIWSAIADRIQLCHYVMDNKVWNMSDTNKHVGVVKCAVYLLQKKKFNCRKLLLPLFLSVLFVLIELWPYIWLILNDLQRSLQFNIHLIKMIKHWQKKNAIKIYTINKLFNRHIYPFLTQLDYLTLLIGDQPQNLWPRKACDVST